MSQSPDFSITGDPFFDSTAVNFEVALNPRNDESDVQACEWYLDGRLIIQPENSSFSEQVSCGSHKIGVCLLIENIWSGIKELDFITCKVRASENITGSENLEAGESSLYGVVWNFIDGTSADMTSYYTFSSSAGGSFSGNLFTADPPSEADEPPLAVAITASKGEDTPLTKQITIDYPVVLTAGVLVVDIFVNTSLPDNNLNVIGLIDNEQVVDNHVPAYTGANIIPAGTDPANAFILASDKINQQTLNWRFLFNLGRLKLDYPAIESFRFYIKGRGEVAGSVTGAYNLKDDLNQMVLDGSAGSYIPTTTGGGQIGTNQPYSTSVVDGANGSYAEADLTTMLVFDFDVASDTVTQATFP